MVHGLPEIQDEKQLCDSCLVGKQARQAFPKATSYRSSHALELLHASLCGLISPSTLSQNLYIFVIIDDCTRYMWSILLKEKGYAFEKFKEFKKLVEKEVNKEIVTVYISQPERFEKKGEEHKVFKLQKVLYGLRQAP